MTKLPCFKVPEEIVVIRVSAFRYRVAKITGSARYVHLFNKPVTGLKRAEFITKSLTFKELYEFLEAVSTEEALCEG